MLSGSELSQEWKFLFFTEVARTEEPLEHDHRGFDRLFTRRSRTLSRGYVLGSSIAVLFLALGRLVLTVMKKAPASQYRDITMNIAPPFSNRRNALSSATTVQCPRRLTKDAFL